jgi:hypothetical protein
MSDQGPSRQNRIANQPVDSAALQRLIAEVSDRTLAPSAADYHRTYNRRNR